MLGNHKKTKDWTRPDLKHYPKVCEDKEEKGGRGKGQQHYRCHSHCCIIAMLLLLLLPSRCVIVSSWGRWGWRGRGRGRGRGQQHCYCHHSHYCHEGGPLVTIQGCCNEGDEVQVQVQVVGTEHSAHMQRWVWTHESMTITYKHNCECRKCVSLGISSGIPITDNALQWLKKVSQYLHVFH